VKKPVSKFAFQMHNLRRYAAGKVCGVVLGCTLGLGNLLFIDTLAAVGLCTLESS
jgi:hypothetical protein